MRTAPRAPAPPVPPAPPVATGPPILPAPPVRPPAPAAARPEAPPAPSPASAATRAPAGERPGGPATVRPQPPAPQVVVPPPPARGPRQPPVVSPRSAARFAERVRLRRTLARRKVAALVGGVVALAAVAWVLLWSPVLALDPARVRVTGASTVVAVDQVDAVVAARSGVPLPRLDTVALRDELLDVPGVREVRVLRLWPHGLAVELVARQPAAAVPEADGGFVLLDTDGVQVGRVDDVPDGLPVVDVPVGRPRVLAAVLRVLEGLPADLLAQVADVSAGTEDTVRLGLRDGVAVEWGSADGTALKAAVLATLRASADAAGVTVYDVSAPTMPITR
ncbi:hypothetical protein Cma02nite_05000 [Cellulomonas marina]|nr:hypothetical protein Cma02nite_05000 [Cellulomonas marina]